MTYSAERLAVATSRLRDVLDDIFLERRRCPIRLACVFIHSGTLGAWLAVFALPARASLPARPPAMKAPPNKAPLSLRNRRRDAAVAFLSMSVGLVILVL